MPKCKDWLSCEGISVGFFRYDTVVLGSGAAGLATAERLIHYNMSSVAIVTENLQAGTSRNAGSDKQTYYRLSLFGEESESVKAMAKSLYDGGAVDGDVAFAEAANSEHCFFHLCELGVEFPMDEYGEYVGYKTDHDPCKRGTSIGPYTSRRMCQVLLERVRKDNIPIFDGYQFVRLLSSHGKVVGILCLRLDKSEEEEKFVMFRCNHLVVATGGPAGMYAQSVFPSSQHGASGFLLHGGLRGKNLTEWQFGMASLSPRWNVSGSYMQVLPRFYSTLQDGISDECEFLNSEFINTKELLDLIFLKGYQWPFDVRKLNGSSKIDLLVYRETVIRNRRVFLDYRGNANDKTICFADLSPETHQYLDSVGVEFGTPIQRLRKMNEPAYQFYLDHGVDLEKDPLEIAVCVQHNNGGFDVDYWWRTNIQGVFACGEAACTHGVYRPGGSALNAGQVGAERAAYYISHSTEKHEIPSMNVIDDCENEIAETIRLATQITHGKEQNVFDAIDWFTTEMSKSAGIVREPDGMVSLFQEGSKLLASFGEKIKAHEDNLPVAFMLLDILYAQQSYLRTYIDFAKVVRASRGSSLYRIKDGKVAVPILGASFNTEIGQLMPRGDQVQIIEGSEVQWRPVHPIPSITKPFEKVWEDFRKGKILD